MEMYPTVIYFIVTISPLIIGFVYVFSVRILMQLLSNIFKENKSNLLFQ